MTKTLLLGTRMSKLALAQSRQVARAVEAHNPDVKVELVGIETLADESKGGTFATTPLQELDGKNFFVKELDEHLLEGKTDFSVHSYKDLSLDRDGGIQLVAIPKREDARDIVFFSKAAKEKLKTGEPIHVGSASPRRVQNVPPYLEHIFGCPVQMQPLRGNVTTRLGRLQEELGSERYLDAVVLAVAGIKRLLKDDEFASDMQALLTNTPCLFMPLDVCPTAPAQGALGIECRSDDEATKQILKNALHDSATADAIAVERDMLKQYGGGCHQAFGASAYKNAQGEHVLRVYGKLDNGEPIDKTIGAADATDQRDNGILHADFYSAIRT